MRPNHLPTTGILTKPGSSTSRHSQRPCREGAIAVSFTWQDFLREVSRLLDAIEPNTRDAALQLDVGIAQLFMRANRIGQMLLDDGTLTADQLGAALAESESTGQQLGNILVKQGLVSPKRLAALLHEQRQRNGIGQLLLNLGMISADQLDEALSTQERQGGKLGDILVKKGFLQQQQMDAVLKAKRGSQLLGQLLVSAGHITNAQLQQALKEQAATSQLLGTILTRHGFCSEATVKAALHRQSFMNRIGGILLRLGYITHGQLEQALIVQAESGQLLGQAVVTLGFCTPNQVQQALELRRDLLKLGRRLVRAKVISANQLDEALTIQEETGLKLGQILIKLGYVKAERLEAFRNAAGMDEKEDLGTRLMKQAVISRGQLLRAKEASRQSGKPIGEVLLQLGILSQEQVRAVVAAQVVMNRRMLDSVL